MRGKIFLLIALPLMLFALFVAGPAQAGQEFNIESVIEAAMTSATVVPVANPAQHDFVVLPYDYGPAKVCKLVRHDRITQHERPRILRNWTQEIRRLQGRRTNNDF